MTRFNISLTGFLLRNDANLLYFIQSVLNSANYIMESGLADATIYQHFAELYLKNWIVTIQ